MKISSRTGEITLSLAAVVIFAIAIFAAREWPKETALFPVLLASIGLLLAIAALAGDLLRDTAASPETPVPEAAKGTSAPSEEQATHIATFLWICGFFASVMLGGYVWGLPVMALAYYRFEARLSWVASVLTAIACSIFLYVSVAVLHIELYEGLIAELIR